MADNLTAEQRKRNMSAIKSRHTKPEIIVRSIIHRLGFRFRLHDKKLPGKPDIVLPKKKKSSSFTAVSGTSTTANAETSRRKPTPNTGRTNDFATSKEIKQTSKHIEKKAGRF